MHASYRNSKALLLIIIENYRKCDLKKGICADRIWHAKITFQMDDRLWALEVDQAKWQLSDKYHFLVVRSKERLDKMDICVFGMFFFLFYG